MNLSQDRGRGIERKFFVAIFWVGILPMTLTLIVAYVFARESQWVTTKRNLTTAVKRTTEGVKLAINNRIACTQRLSEDPLLETFLKLPPEERVKLTEEIRNRFTKITKSSNGMTVAFAILDNNKNILVDTENFDIGIEIIPEWYKNLEIPKIIAITTIPSTHKPTFTIAAPIKDTRSSKTLGFLLETQSIDDLIEFALGSSSSPERGGLSSEHIYYSISFLSEKNGIYIYKHPTTTLNSVINYKYESIDKRLIQRIKRASPKGEGIITLFSFPVNNKRQPVLIAFQKILPEYELYTIVFRPFYEIFWFIHVGSIVALILAGLVILIFSVIGYQIVHKNILMPLSLINEGAQIIRQGDLELKLKINTGDELQEVAESFNEMASTLRKNIKELEESERRYRTLVNSMREGIFQCDEAGNIIFINPAGAKIFGYDTPEEIIGINLTTFLSNSDDLEFICHHLNSKGFIYQHRLWVKPNKGNLICIEMSADKKQDPTKKTIILEGIFRDITQNVLLEKEVNERAERIRAVNLIAQTINSSLEAGKVYETVLEEIKRLIPSADIVILAVTHDKSEKQPTTSEYEVLHKFSKGKVYFTTPDKCIKKLIEKSGSFHYDFLQSENEELSKEFPPTISSLLGLSLYSEDEVLGCLILASENPQAFSSPEKNTVEELAPHIAVAIRNAKLLNRLKQTLEEVNHAKEQLNKANEELKTLDEMKTNLLSNVSHELRTPLVAVMGYTDMILKEKAGPITETQREFLSISMRNIEKLVALIENLLDFSKLYKGKEELIFTTFDIVECAENGLQNILPMAEPKGISLEIKYPERPILVDGDKGKILQVMNNLLSNAVKFNKPKGKITVTIEKIEDKEVEISVSDTGIGIPEEALDKIFTRFYQVDSSSTRKYGGAGIGLAISQDIIRLHGSSITVKSKLGEGSTFTFRLPLHGRTPSKLAKFDKELAPEETHLLVELVTQDRSLNAQVRQWLIEDNIDLISASHPSMAISLYLKYNPDCIIIDCEDTPLGLEQLKELLENPALGQEPLVILSNNSKILSLYPDKPISLLSRYFNKSKLITAVRYAVKSAPSEAPAELGDAILYLDNEELTKLAKPILQSEGYKIETTTTGEDALEKLQSGKFRVFISELILPGLDIWEILKTIKSIPKLKGLKIILTTTRNSKEIEDNCKKYNLNIDGILPKPFTPNDLFGIIKRFLPTTPMK